LLIGALQERMSRRMTAQSDVLNLEALKSLYLNLEEKDDRLSNEKSRIQ
jgi:hypothetical protein